MTIVLYFIHAVGASRIHVRLLQKINLRILSSQRPQNPGQIGIDPFLAFGFHACAAIHKEVLRPIEPGIASIEGDDFQHFPYLHGTILGSSRYFHRLDGIRVKLRRRQIADQPRGGQHDHQHQNSQKFQQFLHERFIPFQNEKSNERLI